MSWFNSGGTLKKSQYYVWFLGSSESEGLRGRDYVLPVMHQLLRDATHRFPNKVTVEISGKGVKLIQTIPTINKSGKLKMEVMKFVVPSHSLAFSMIGPSPWSDVVCCIMLVFNPETKCPVHVHCYRCDSPETAAFMNTSLQSLICRRDNQRRLDEMEQRLRLNGLLPPFRPISSPIRITRQTHTQTSIGHQFKSSPSNSSSRVGDDDYMGMSSDEEENYYHDSSSDDDRVTRLHQALFQELKERLRSKVPVMNPSHMQLSTTNYDTHRRSVASHKTSAPFEAKKNWWKQKCEQQENHTQSRHVSHRLMGGDDGAMTSSTSGLGSELSSSAGRFRFSIAEIPGACSPSGYADCLAEGPPRRRNSQSCLYTSDLQSRPLPAPGWRARRLLQPPPYRHPSTEQIHRLPSMEQSHRLPSLEQIHRLAPSLSPPLVVDRHMDRRPTATRAFRLFGDTFKPQKRGDVIHPHKHCTQPNPPPLPQRRPTNNIHSTSQNWVTATDRRYRSVDNLHIDAAAAENLDGWGRGSAWNLPGMFDPFGKKYEQRPKVDSFWKNRAKRSSWYIPSSVHCPI